MDILDSEFGAFDAVLETLGMGECVFCMGLKGRKKSEIWGREALDWLGRS